MCITNVSLKHSILPALLIASFIMVDLCPVQLSGETEPGKAAFPVSPQTEECLGCHSQLTPGIVAHWKKSRHAQITPQAALKKEKLQRRVSITQPGEKTGKFVVGCAECHTLKPETHKDTFEHSAYNVHTVVTPADCSVCHPVEAAQYKDNKMANAYGNLLYNPLYLSLIDSINAAFIR